MDAKIPAATGGNTSLPLSKGTLRKHREGVMIRFQFRVQLYFHVVHTPWIPLPRDFYQTLHIANNPNNMLCWKKKRSCLGLPAQPHSNGITAQPVLTRFFSDLPTFILLSTQRYNHVTVINMHRTLKTLHTLWCCPWRKKWMVIQNGSSAGTWLIKWNKNRCKTYSINDHIKMPNKNSSENADKALSLESR